MRPRRIKSVGGVDLPCCTVAGRRLAVSGSRSTMATSVTVAAGLLGVTLHAHWAAAQSQEVSPAVTQRKGATTRPEPGTIDEAVIGVFGLAAAPIDDDLVTDRPDFTESAEAVPWGRFQLEAGYTFTYDREHQDRLRQHVAPEFLLRVGIVEDFELRFGWEGYSIAQSNFQGASRAGRPVGIEQWEQGATDFAFGFKLKFAGQDELRPHMAILGSATFPTGSPSVSSGDVEPSIGLLWSYDLTDVLAIAGQFTFSVPTDDGDQFLQSAASLSLAFSLTDQLGSYVEYFGI